MASLVINALESALYTGSSPKGQYWAFRHPNPDAPPQTYRLSRRNGNGWTLLLAASRETKELLAFYTENADDHAAVRDALKWLGIDGKIEGSEEGVILRLADGQVIRSQPVGGEKPKKR